MRTLGVVSFVSGVLQAFVHTAFRRCFSRTVLGGSHDSSSRGFRGCCRVSKGSIGFYKASNCSLSLELRVYVGFSSTSENSQPRELGNIIRGPGRDRLRIELKVPSFLKPCAEEVVPQFHIRLHGHISRDRCSCSKESSLVGSLSFVHGGIPSLYGSSADTIVMNTPFLQHSQESAVPP